MFHNNKKHREHKIMTCREALKVLMLSPFYFKLDLAARLELLNEFMRICNHVGERGHKKVTN